MNDNGIIQLNIGEFRNNKQEFNLPLVLEHSPTVENQSHTLMHGITRANKTKIRRKLSKIASWADGMKPLN